MWSKQCQNIQVETWNSLPVCTALTTNEPHYGWQYALRGRSNPYTRHGWFHRTYGLLKPTAEIAGGSDGGRKRDMVTTRPSKPRWPCWLHTVCRLFAEFCGIVDETSDDRELVVD
jgi:hypothetical protein